MHGAPRLTHDLKVALLAEGVDRNRKKAKATEIEVESPSSRRAWIEMQNLGYAGQDLSVALLAEGVDRNNQVPRLNITRSRRPPRGGRG